MRLERVQYEADLAQRRYEEVDPANRLVAASLEKRWNEALVRVEEVHRQMAEFQRQQTRTFTPQQREQILALAGDFPRLWQSDTTSAKDKKRMLRLLVDNVTVERGKERNVLLHVCWAGGAREDLEITLPPRVQDQVRYPTERVEEVRRLAKDHTDLEIAERFNARGEVSSKGKPFTVAIIKWIRHKHRIPAPKLKLPHELTVNEIAEKFGVSRGVVYYWINRDVLPARRLGDGHPYWITLTDVKAKELHRWVRSSTRIESIAS
jgi:excisionase family DNA binding protein